MGIVERDASIFIVHVDSDLEDEELVLLQNRRGLDFIFIDADEQETDCDYEEGLEFAKLFIERLGWNRRHHA